MQCPYCAEHISDEAIVCPYCRHDLAPSKHLINKTKALAEEVETLRTELATLRAQSARSLSDAQALARRQKAPVDAVAGEFLRNGFVPIALLLFAHFLIILVWDKPTVYLRIVSILIPIPFGFAYVRREQPFLTGLSLMAAAVSALAIFGMSLAVALHDSVPVFPASAQEWNEDIQYFVSITLAFITGGLLATLVDLTSHLANTPSRSVQWVAKIVPLLSSKHNLAKGKKAKTIQMIERALGIQRVIMGLVATATTAAAIYTGVMSVLH